MRGAWLPISCSLVLLACGSGGSGGAGGGASGGSGGSGGNIGGSGGAGGAVGGSGGDIGGSGGAGGAVGGSGGSAGGSGGGSGQACTWGAAAGCPANEYCNAPGCAAGTCTPLANIEVADKDAVCGCDGANYWNASIASIQGMSVAAAGECAQPVTCVDLNGGVCSTGANHFCNFYKADASGCAALTNIGTCWAMPKTCPVINGFGGTLRACNADPNGACSYECEAIKAETPYFPDMSCPV